MLHAALLDPLPLTPSIGRTPRLASPVLLFHHEHHIPIRPPMSYPPPQSSAPYAPPPQQGYGGYGAYPPPQGGQQQAYYEQQNAPGGYAPQQPQYGGDNKQGMALAPNGFQGERFEPAKPKFRDVSGGGEVEGAPPGALEGGSEDANGAGPCSCGRPLVQMNRSAALLHARAGILLRIRSRVRPSPSELR